MAPREVVGREPELAALAAFPAGDDAMLVLEGEPGIGKTTLWLEGVRELEDAGHRILRAMPAAAERNLRLSGLADLLEPVAAEVLPQLPPAQQRVLESALLLGGDGAVEPADARALGLTMRGAVRALAAETPVAICIDDAQWLDAASISALVFCLRRVHDAPVRVLLAGRSGLRSAFGAFAAAHVVVGPLSLGALQRLLRTELDVSLPRRTLRRVVEMSGGNPFYALELARAARRRVIVLSEPLEALVAERLRDLPPEAARLVDVLSLARRARLAELEKVGVLNGLDEAIREGVAVVDGDAVRFAHPLLAAGADARLQPAERRRLHAALGAAVDDPVERARHLAAATLQPDDAIAGEIASAAHRAAGHGRAAAAAELFEEAARLTNDGDVARLRRRDAAESHIHAGDYERARELLVAEEPRGDVLTLRARVTEDLAERRALLERAIAQTDEPTVRVDAHALLVRVHLYHDDLDAALAAARAGDAAAQETGDRELIAAATATRGLIEIWATGVPDKEVFRRAVELVDQGGPLPRDTYSNPRTLVGARPFYRYELDEARTHYLAAASAAAESGDVDSVETFWWALAQLELRAGDVDAARAYLAKLHEDTDTDDRRPLSIQWLDGVVAAHVGDVEDAREAFARALELAENARNSFFVVYVRSSIGQLELSLGDAHAAADVLRPALDAAIVRRGDPGMTAVLPNAVEAFIATGSSEEAQALLDDLEERSRRLGHRWGLAAAARCRGLLLAASGRFREAGAAFDDALSLHAELPVPLELARTQLARGVVARRAKQRRVARESLEASCAAFEAIGASVWATRARTELARVGGRTASAGELTPAEQRVAALVASGKTNKEVAAELFVSVHTVEAALTRIYAKLDVRSRSALAATLSSKL